MEAEMPGGTGFRKLGFVIRGISGLVAHWPHGLEACATEGVTMWN